MLSLYNNKKILGNQIKGSHYVVKPAEIDPKL